MQRQRMVFIGLCLVLILGLILVNVGLGQQTKASESTQAAPATGETKKPAVSTEGKAAESTPAKASEKPKAEGKKPSTEPPKTERSADPGKLPGKFVPSEGC